MRLSFSLPRRRAAKPLLAAATLALLAGCANGFDPVKIVIAPVTEFINQMENAKQAKNTEPDKDQGNVTSSANAKQQGATKSAAAADPNQPASWDGVPVGEMSVGGETVLVVSAATNNTLAFHASVQKFGKLAEYEGVLHQYDTKYDRCSSTGGLPSLSYAFLDDDGTIVNIADANRSVGEVCAAAPVSRILIMSYQWFSENGIKAGDKVTDFKPVTNARQAQIVAEFKAASAARAQVRAQRKAEEDKRKAEENRLRAEAAKRKAEEDRLRAEAAKRKADAEAARAQQAAVLRRMLERGKPDVDVANMRELTLGTNRLLVFQSRVGHFALLPDEGFLYSSPGKDNVYGNQDTFQPLSIAYMAEDGRITRLDNVTAYSRNDDQINNTEKAAYVLVTQFGWFEKHGVKAGDMATFKTVTAKRRDELYALGATTLAQLNQANKQTRIAAAKEAGLDAGTLLQAGKGYQYSYVCGDNEAQSLFYVQSREADGSVSAIYDLLVPDFAKNTVSNLRVQLKGKPNAEGVYAFTPVKTLKNVAGYKLNSIRAWGDLNELDINLSGSKCGPAEALGLWAKAPDAFTPVTTEVDFNAASRVPHLAEIYYAVEPDKSRSLVKKRDPGLGLTLAVGGKALPGDVPTYSQLLRAGDGKALRNGVSVGNCAEAVSILQCLPANSRKDGTGVTELERIQAAHAKKVAWTPLDFAPQHELAYYELLPGADGQTSTLHLNYRHARYAYLQSRIKHLDRRAEFEKHYTVKLEKRVIKKVDEAKHSALGNVDGGTSINAMFGSGLAGLGGSESFVICSDYIYTVSIKPKSAANRKPVSVDINWQIDQYQLKDGKDHVEPRIIPLHHTLNAKNNYTYQDTLTFECVTVAEKSRTRVLFITSNTEIVLKDVKFGSNIVRVYD